MAEADEQVWTVGKLLSWTTNWFAEHQVEGSRLAAELLLARALNCRKIELYTRFDQQPSDEQRASFRELVKQAARHVPIAYLLGTREFFSLEFNVSPAVLIPRPETEALVQRAVELCRSEPQRTWRILDVGTGSGCIAVAIAKYAANAAVVAGDISPEALAVAASNVEKHQVGERVQLVQADVVAVPPERLPAGGFDLVVSNPPYISEAEFAALPANVREHEPRAALTCGDDGLAIFRRLAAEAPAVLTGQGRLLVEVAYNQQTQVRDVMASSGNWKYAGAHRNPSDAYDRVLEFQRT